MTSRNSASNFAQVPTLLTTINHLLHPDTDKVYNIQLRFSSMKVYISADIEGICGVVALDHTRRDGRDYSIARTLMAKEVNAAAEGAFEGGASEVVVNDSHGSKINLILEELDERLTIISGSPKPLSMMQGIDECDAAFFVGYHSRAGTLDAVMDHTYNGRVVYNAQVNNTPMGECGINAALAGYFGVPVILVTGDTKVTEEALHLFNHTEVVSTKEGIGRFAAKSFHPSKVREEIRKKAQKAVKTSNAQPFTVEPPLRLEMDFMLTNMADAVALIPGIERISPRSVAYECSDFLTLYRTMRAMIMVASAGAR
jgi:D-amino peptidase